MSTKSQENLQVKMNTLRLEMNEIQYVYRNGIYDTI